MATMALRAMLVGGSITELEILARELRNGGIGVCGAALDLAGALSVIRRSIPDLALVDDGAGGLATVRELSRMGLSVILVTATHQPAYSHAAIQAGASMVLAKPLDIERLVQRLSAAASTLVA